MNGTIVTGNLNTNMKRGKMMSYGDIYPPANEDGLGQTLLSPERTNLADTLTSDVQLCELWRDNSVM